jgi:hypothetical protein
MKSYAEKNGEAPFDWRQFLTKIKRSKAEWNKAQELAVDWVTCSCGVQCAIIPRKEGESKGQPVDDLLTDLGGDRGFYQAIMNENVEQALHFLDLIEVRSAYLIKQEIPNLVEKIEEAKKELAEMENLLAQAQS